MWKFLERRQKLASSREYVFENFPKSTNVIIFQYSPLFLRAVASEYTHSRLNANIFHRQATAFILAFIAARN